MPTLIYSTRIREPGPWLLEQPALEALDKILEDVWLRLATVETEMVDKLAEENVRSQTWLKSEEERASELLKAKEKAGGALAARHERRTVILLARGDKLAVTDFGEAARHPEPVQQTSKGFEVSLHRADIRIGISFSREYNNLEIATGPEASEDARDIFGALFNWSRTIAPARWQRLWTESFEPVFAWAAYAFLAVAILLIATTPTTKNTAREQAHELLKHGVNQANYVRAIELSLALASDYSVVSQSPGMSSTGWLVLACGLGICVLVSIKPRSTLGLGRGAKEVRWWRAWMKFVSVTIPSVICSNFIWPMIHRLIGH